LTAQVREWYAQHLAWAEVVVVDEQCLKLRDAYVQANILTSKWLSDAEHVATASVHQCKIIVSWNFKHIVHHDKVPLYNAVNLLHRYPTLSINTPAEILYYEE
jgi:hypothetical protein